MMKQRLKSYKSFIYNSTILSDRSSTIWKSNYKHTGIGPTPLKDEIQLKQELKCIFGTF